jgi:hypothetical protein
MKKLTLLLLAIVMTIPTFAAPKKNATVKIINQSKWEIHHLYLSSTDNEEWGPDQLGENVIDAKGGTFLLHSIPCDDYDVKVVDEDGDECVIEDVTLCGDRSYWKITDKDLLACEGYSD